MIRTYIAAARRVMTSESVLQIALAALMAALAALPGWAGGQKQPPKTPPLPDTVEAHLARAQADLANQRLTDAEREYRAALALDPRLTVRARFPLAVVLFGLQKRAEARQEFENVRAETGDDPNVNYYLGRLDLIDHKYDSAIRNLTLAAAQPPFPDTYFYLGSACFKKGDLDAAEKWLKKALAVAPRDPLVETRLGNLYQAQGRQEKARKAFARATELRQDDSAATQLGLECSQALATQPLDEARPLCQKLFDPNDEGRLATLGMLYGQHGDYPEALEPFRLAAGLDPDSYEMQFNLGLTYFRLKRYREARTPLEKAAALRPDSFEVVAPLAATLYALGDDAAAYPVLDRANRLRPENAEVSGLLVNAALNLAAKSWAKRDAAQARLYLARAAEARPNDPEPHRRLAQIEEASGDLAAAQRDRDLAKALSPH